MFAINHAATALPLKRAFPRVPLALLLVSVQLVELLWVVLNLIGIERLTTEAEVRAVSDIHLVHMPWSHSVLAGVVIATIGGAWMGRVTCSRSTGVAVGLGILSHLVLDLFTHAPDIALSPWGGADKLGAGLYASAPAAAFLVETGWGVLCWWIYRGSRSLLVAIVLFNLANATMYTAAVVGLEGLLAGRPVAIAATIGAQILLTLLAVGFLASPRSKKPAWPTALETTRSDVVLGRRS
ncbi:MAG: metal-dependent hydrolase [Myxococcales bacterium]|jgi:hypothetical protein